MIKYNKSTKQLKIEGLLIVGAETEVIDLKSIDDALSPWFGYFIVDNTIINNATWVRPGRLYRVLAHIGLLPKASMLIVGGKR